MLLERLNETMSPPERSKGRAQPLNLCDFNGVFSNALTDLWVMHQPQSRKQASLCPFVEALHLSAKLLHEARPFMDDALDGLAVGIRQAELLGPERESNIAQYQSGLSFYQGLVFLLVKPVRRSD
ncbi:hypothetical protein AMJ85_00780 [candidate division BRC1 bacterium SM23_51]|nr:MAG: hypothetical protein AMJ85_00780 [candidate division BRC1 bacterium SM23_51]